MTKHLLAGMALAAVVAAGPAMARPHYVNGTVYRTTPQGVYMQTADGVTFIPNGQASFQLGNTVVNLPNLVTGSQYRINYATPNYTPNYVPVEYYRAHQDWDWNRYQRNWRSDRNNGWWRDSNGNWHHRNR